MICMMRWDDDDDDNNEKMKNHVPLHPCRILVGIELFGVHWAMTVASIPRVRVALAIMALTSDACFRPASAPREKVNFDFGWRHRLTADAARQCAGDAWHQLRHGRAEVWKGSVCRYLTATIAPIHHPANVGTEQWDHRCCKNGLPPSKERKPGWRMFPRPEGPPKEAAVHLTTVCGSSSMPVTCWSCSTLTKAPVKTSVHSENAGWYKSCTARKLVWRILIRMVEARLLPWNHNIRERSDSRRAQQAIPRARLDSITNISSLRRGCERNCPYVDASTRLVGGMRGGLIRHNYLMRANPTHFVEDSYWPVLVFCRTIQSTRRARCTSGRGFWDSDESLAARAIVFDAEAAVVEQGCVRCRATQFGCVLETTQLDIQHPYLYRVELHLSISDQFDNGVNITTGIANGRFDPLKSCSSTTIVKLRGFCDHSSFGGVGGAVADGINCVRKWYVVLVATRGGWRITPSTSTAWFAGRTGHDGGRRAWLWWFPWTGGTPWKLWATK